MKKLIISIIVPVYGVEDYIAKSMQSLLDQTFTNFEAIIVNDGTLDNSIEVAKSVVKDDPRFIFLEKKNGGQASARNLGLDIARGEYIGFLDPDDYFKEDALEKSMNIFNRHKSIDVVLFGISKIDHLGNIIHTKPPNLTQYLLEKDFLLSKHSIDYSVCNKIFTKELFNNTRFIEGIIYEDKAVLPILLYGKNLYAIKESLYFYQYRPGSTMNSYTPLSHKSYLKIYETYKVFLEEKNIFTENKEYYEKSYILYCFYNEIIQSLKHSNSFHNDARRVIKDTNPHILNINKINKHFSWKSKQFISYFLLKISPYLFKYAYLIGKKIKNLCEH